jgi:hypothetical protein
VAGSLVGWALLAAVLRAVVLLPERCPAVDVASIDRAAAGAVGWFAANQAPDGSWLYRYRASDDADLGGYNVVRHAGVLLSLYQAAARGVPAAGPVAVRGLAWARDHVVDGPGWGALGDPGQPLEVGASALLVAALVERRSWLGDRSLDGLLDGLGRFLVAQLEPSGAVPERWDPVLGGPTVGSYSPFYTGETFWALARLHAAFPDGPWEEPALRVGRYLVEQRDRAEDAFPPVSDHWAAYGLAEVRRWPGGAQVSAALDPGGRYATRLGHIMGVQVRYESQRTGDGISRWTRGPQALGAALGTVGEAEGNLWVLAGLEPDLAAERTVFGRRARCVAGMLVERQVAPSVPDGSLGAGQAPPSSAGPPPSGGSEGQASPPAPVGSPGSPGAASRRAGAWFHHGVTQMDDQQHALSALLQARPIAAAGDGGSAR